MAAFRTLISRETLLARIGELAVQIRDHYRAAPPCVVCVTEGARTFTSQLLRRLPFGPNAHEIRARSYGDATVSSGEVEVIGGESIPMDGHRVLLLEDIVDTGRTIAKLRQHFLERGATGFEVATLLTKPSRRVVSVDLRFVGFEIPDEFVVGFGMDFAGRFRELDRVAVYEETRAAEA